MQCIFSELVLNHYFKKNNILAKALSIGYGKKQNSLPRTVLYSLKENNEYNNAVAEYLLGSKRKFLSYFLPPEVVERQREYGSMISLDFSPQDVFNMHPNSFAQIDENSIFCHKNTMIYALWLQTIVTENVLCDEFLDCSSKDEIVAKYEEKYHKSPIENEESTKSIPTERHTENESKTISTSSIGKRSVRAPTSDRDAISETFEEWQRRILKKYGIDI